MKRLIVGLILLFLIYYGADTVITNMHKTTIHSFIPLERLGEGTFSSVYKVRRISDGQIYALKKIKIASLKEKEKANALNEIRILASLTSKHIITYKQAFFDENLKLLCVIMEWADEGDLLQKINHNKTSKTLFSQAQIWKIVYHLAKGLSVLHKNKVLHRDLKSANIFIGKGLYKIGDLNVSKVINDQNMVKTQTGTPYYASPQVWRDQLYNHKSDIWSLGCIIYEACSLKPPFLGDSLQELNRNIQKGKYLPIPSTFSSELQELISSCLNLRPQLRPNSQEILESKTLQTKCRFYDILSEEEKEGERVQPMLATIKMPVDIKALNSQLPQSKYECKEKNNRSSSLPTRTNDTEKKQAKNHSVVVQGLNEIQKIVKNLSSLPSASKKIGNTPLPLPQRIKHHLEQISQNNSKILNRRPKYRIQTSVVRQKPVVSHIGSLNVVSSTGKNKSKVRPFSCQIKSRRTPNLMQLPGLQPYKSRKIQRSVEHQPSSYLSSENKRYVKPDIWIQKQEQCRKPQSIRCRSAQYRQINSSYQQLKKRLQNRGKYLNNCHVKASASSIVHQSCEHLTNKDKPVPFITKDVYIRNGSLLKRIDQKTSNRQYLQEIQNKLQSSGAKNKKCVTVVSSGVDFQMNRLKSVCNKYNQGCYAR